MKKGEEEREGVFFSRLGRVEGIKASVGARVGKGALFLLDGICLYLYDGSKQGQGIVLGGIQYKWNVSFSYDTSAPKS